MKRRTVRLFAVLLAGLVLTVGLAALILQARRLPVEEKPELTVAYTGFAGRFSPFFARAQGDRDAVELTQLRLLTTDRQGRIIHRAIDGESVPFGESVYTYTGPADVRIYYDGASGVTTYTATVRQDLTFSDGAPLTADDIIFNYYVRLDADYDGPSRLKSCGILGARDYRTQTTPALYERYAALAAVIAGAGETHVWTAADGWTQAQQESLWFHLRAAGQDMARAEEAFAAEWGPLDPDRPPAGIDRIAGIRKLDAYTVEVQAAGYDPSRTEEILGIQIAPLHYYGDGARYDYERQRFGFTRGDLSDVRAQSDTPLGAGPYIFAGFTDGVVTLEGNAAYYKGAPATGQLRLLTVAHPEDLRTHKAALTVLPGDAVVTAGVARSEVSYEARGVCYVGIDAARVKVGEDGGSAASRALRQGLLTALAVCAPEEARDIGRLPLSAWNGAPPADRTETALACFAAAGFTVDNGRVLDVPVFSLLLPDDTPLPVVKTVESAAALLETMGVGLDIQWAETAWFETLLDGTGADLWCGRWEEGREDTAPAPDLYARYGEQRRFGIADKALETALRTAGDEGEPASARLSAARAAQTLLDDWAVELPLYRERARVLVRPDMVDVRTLTPDMTAFYPWWREAERIALLRD